MYRIIRLHLTFVQKIKLLSNLFYYIMQRHGETFSGNRGGNFKLFSRNI